MNSPVFLKFFSIILDISAPKSLIFKSSCFSKVLEYYISSAKRKFVNKQRLKFDFQINLEKKKIVIISSDFETNIFDENWVLFQWVVLAWSWGDLGVVLG